MKRLQIILATILVAIFTSCENMNVTTVNDESEIFIEARYADAETETKTAISEMVGSKVKFTWLAGDAINVFFGASESSIFVTNTTDRVAQFKGTIGAVTGGGDDLNDETSLWGVYPYNKSTVCDGSSVKISLPHVQEAKADNLADDLYPSLARSSNFTMAFYPICGSFRFKVSNPDIVKVTLCGNDNEYLAGRATVSMSLGGTPEVTEITEGKKELVMTAPDGGYFETDKYYYFVLYPSDLSKGYTITYYKEDTKDSFIKQEAYPIGRNKFGGKTEGDKELAFDKSISVYAEYIDEYGVNHGPGVEIDGVVWAPVNCGYKAPTVDAQGNVTDKGYPYGKLYQWGRKYGQGYTLEYDATVPTIVEGPVDISEGQLESNANVFYTATASSNNWALYTNGELWNKGTESEPKKTEYDPCPAGWRVPTENELDALSENYSEWTSAKGQNGRWFSGGFTYNNDAPQVFLPAAGCRYYSAGDTDTRSYDGYYWCSRPLSPGSYELGLDIDLVWMSGYNGRAAGYSVRCVKDSNASNIENDVKVESIYMLTESATLAPGTTYNLDTDYVPKDATNTTWKWSSSDASVAYVDDSGNVTAIADGEAIITATATDGSGVSASSTIAVVAITAVASTEYKDEYGVNHGRGIAIGDVVWAPVNCGYKAPTVDAQGNITDKGYPYGKLYQWGRKYGQGYDQEYDSTERILSEGPVSINAQSKNNENIFYYMSNSDEDWLHPSDNTLWNLGTEDNPIKGNNDPCPQNWRVPTYKELSDLTKNSSSGRVNNALGQVGWIFSGIFPYQTDGPKIFLPLCGVIVHDGYSGWRNSYGDYWCSKAYNDGNAYRLWYGDRVRLDIYGKANAYSVRCVQE